MLLLALLLLLLRWQIVALWGSEPQPRESCRVAVLLLDTTITAVIGWWWWPSSCHIIIMQLKQQQQVAASRQEVVLLSCLPAWLGWMPERRRIKLGLLLHWMVTSTICGARGENSSPRPVFSVRLRISVRVIRRESSCSLSSSSSRCWLCGECRIYGGFGGTVSLRDAGFWNVFRRGCKMLVPSQEVLC